MEEEKKKAEHAAVVEENATWEANLIHSQRCLMAFDAFPFLLG